MNMFRPRTRALAAVAVLTRRVNRSFDLFGALPHQLT